MKKIDFLLLFVLALIPCSAYAAPEEDSQAEIAKKLQNPIAKMISIPFQFNYDAELGQSHNGSRLTLNIQPVIPFSFNQDWDIVSRTILPVMSQSNLTPTSGTQAGLGDTTQSFFFAPVNSGRLLWGAGPVFLIPTATNRLLGTGKWGIGPTFCVLDQNGPTTYGLLANHLWSVAGESGRADVSATFLQPFYSYLFKKTYTTITLMTESTYDWLGRQWTIPLEASVSQMLKVGKMPVSFTLGGKYWLDGPSTAPKWTAKFAVTLILLK
ncbi:MAG: transporter [Candidatus Margulisbacteria bacterium]|nr:transporter [Candidatus Margulisiibacteriota bacterium]